MQHLKDFGNRLQSYRAKTNPGQKMLAASGVKNCDHRPTKRQKLYTRRIFNAKFRFNRKKFYGFYDDRNAKQMVI